MDAVARTPARVLALGLALLVALPLLPGVAANHAQSLPGGGTITFKDKAGGNEWWVEAIVTSTSPVSKVEVMDDGGPWATMANHPEWGSWALSYHVEPGHRVTFRATTAAGTVTSCPFTHPAGAEQCASPPPPPPPPPPATWSADLYSGVSELVNDMATGDTDGDGRGELYVADSIALFHVQQNVVSAVSAKDTWTAVTLGDLDRDGKAEVYAARYSSSTGSWEVYQYTRTGANTWSERAIFLPASSLVARLSVGDIDRDGNLDLYAVGTDVAGHAAAWQLRPTASGLFTATRIFDVADGFTSLEAGFLWVGDADRDGKAELAITVMGRDYGHIFLVDYTTTWTTVDVGPTDDFPGPLVAGDVDGDGLGEIATVGLSHLDTFTLVNGVWVRATVATFTGPVQDVFLGDADNDGRSELYVVDWHDVVLVRKASTGWTKTLLTTLPQPGMRLVVGDGDMDGIREAFVAWFNSDTRVTWITRLQTGAGAFDATFSGVRGNEWWVQTTVSGNGVPLASVDVRLNGGTWQPLTKQSWGGYAASYHILQGMVVQFRATSSTGATDLSDCYRWIPPPNTDASKVACPSEPQPGTFSATFSGVKGNEWWVEAVVTANAPVHGVFVYIGDCTGDPADMSYNANWGKWTLGNTHIPAGTKIVLEAFGDGGSQRSGGYIWPNATPTTGC